MKAARSSLEAIAGAELPAAAGGNCSLPEMISQAEIAFSVHLELFIQDL